MAGYSNLPVYSFLDTYCTFTGSGGSAVLGNGGGVSDEGIALEPIDDNTSTTTGADGSWTHSLIASKAHRITVRLLKTSPQNKILDAMYAYQKTSSLLTGQNTCYINNVSSGDTHTCLGVAFAKKPRVVYGKTAELMEWAFTAGKVDSILGSGTSS